MDIQIEKMELIEMIVKTKKKSIIKKLKLVFENEPILNLTDQTYKMLDERREKHLSGESLSFAWNEVKANLKKNVL